MPSFAEGDRVRITAEFEERVIADLRGREGVVVGTAPMADATRAIASAILGTELPEGTEFVYVDFGVPERGTGRPDQVVSSIELELAPVPAEAAA
jgi:hypothetical protein